MKRTALIILILGIMGFSLFAITGLSYAEDNTRFAKEFAALYREVSQQMDPNTAAVFKDEVRKALETMPNVKKEIARFEDENTIRKENYDIVARERMVIEREERHNNAGSGGGYGNTSPSGSGRSDGNTMTESGNSFQTDNKQGSQSQAN